MATFSTQGSSYGTYEGRYLYLTVTETAVDPVNNRSTLHWELVVTGGSVWYYSTGPTTITIDGTEVYSSARVNNVFPAAKGSKSGTITVSHNPGGDKTVSIGFSTAVYYGASYVRDYGGSMALTNIDRSAPDVSFYVSGITANGMTVNANASALADLWEYSLNGGYSWATFSTNPSTSASVTLSNLSPDTSYPVVVRARKQFNQLYGQSGTSTVRTLGATVLNSVSAFAVDVEHPVVELNWTIYDRSYTHTLAIQIDTNTVVTISDLVGVTGTNKQTVSLTTAQRSALLSAMSGVKTVTAAYTLTTFSGSTQIGAASSNTGTINTTESLSRPIFSEATLADTNAATVALTGDAAQIVQSKSFLTVTCTPATAQNGAAIVQYRAVVAEKSVTSGTASISFGSVDTGARMVTVTAIDSRGYETSISLPITVLGYRDITLDAFLVRRKNNVESTIQLDFSGSLSPVLVSGAAKNNFVRAQYRVKEATATSWSAYTVLTGVTANSTGYSFSDDNWTELPAADAYYVQILVEDKLSSDSETLYIHKGKPLVSFRPEKVGINTNDPQAALDVEGDAAISGALKVQGQPLLDYLKASLTDYFLPVGFVLMTESAEFDPNTAYPGTTWERIKDRFILAAGDTYAAGSTGGAAEVTLTVDQMPAHNHKQSIGNETGSSWARYLVYNESNNGFAWIDADNPNTVTSTVGGDQAHNNMPPYVAKYVWERTA